MYNVAFYSVMSPQETGSTRYGIPVLAMNTVFSGFLTIDTQAPFIATKISTCFSRTAKPGFSSAFPFEYRIWDQSSGRQMFQANVAGIDDGYVPDSMFASRQIGQGITQNAVINSAVQVPAPANMGIAFFNLIEECEFAAGSVIRVDVKPRITPVAGTVYMTFTGFSHV